jgi:hypothetical protein
MNDFGFLFLYFFWKEKRKMKDWSSLSQMDVDDDASISWRKSKKKPTSDVTIYGYNDQKRRKTTSISLPIKLPNKPNTKLQSECVHAVPSYQYPTLINSFFHLFTKLVEYKKCKSLFWCHLSMFIALADFGSVKYDCSFGAFLFYANLICF